MKFAEAAVLGRIIKPENGELSPDVARSLLQLQFDAQDLARMHDLTVRGQTGGLSASEEAELEGYRRIGRMLELMHSKARRTSLFANENR